MNSGQEPAAKTHSNPINMAKSERSSNARPRAGASGTLLVLFLGAALRGAAQDSSALTGTEPLTWSGDLSARMVAGLDKFLMRETERSVGEREKLFQRDFSSVEAYEKSIQPNRERLRKMTGATDARLPIAALEFISSTARGEKLGQTDAFVADAVRWRVFEGVFGEGLWLEPKSAPVARVIAIPDADQTPEMISGLAAGLPDERQFARRLAENGCEVLVPTLIDRQDTWSGNAEMHRVTNQPHREWLYRQGFEVGRHIIGYEVQKALAAVDWFKREGSGEATRRLPPIGIAGYAEGGLIALYAAALDPRIDAALVSGYFDSRQNLWEEPIYRNLFGVLQEFGDAEIASLIAPRALIVEHSAAPKVDGPPKPRDGRSGGAPGRLRTADYESVEKEFERARGLLKAGAPEKFDHFKFFSGAEGMTTGPGSDRALLALLNALGVKLEQIKQPGEAPTKLLNIADTGTSERQRRQVKELENYTQRIFEQSEAARAEFFWKKIKPTTPEEWRTACAPFKAMLWEEAMGRFPAATLPANPRTRQIKSPGQSFTTYETVLDVFPDVFAWGYLLVPKDIKAGERRPVVVCQHGLEGEPADTVTSDSSSQAFAYYKAFAARLAERGFITFAPHNPYRGADKFRVLQRKANPLKKSLFSIIIAQHDRILDWLSELPFVDPKRIGFYGLSYGGKTAMRVPAVLDRYVLSICSGDFNEWVKKNVSVDFPGSYMFTAEYEMPEWDLGHTFSYAEMAAIIAPRPFMVERGHNDGVGIDEWVSYEYAKVRRLYDQLAIPQATTIEYFNGPHTIHGVGTFEFLHRYLDWPAPKQQANR